MKKIGILLTVLFLLVCVASCGAEEAQTEPGETVDTSTRSDPGSEPGETVDSSTRSDTESEPGETVTTENKTETEAHTAMKMNVQIGDRTFSATLEDNDAVRELVEMMKESPVTLEMRDYSGFEKVGPLGRSLPADDRQTTTVAGDIVLYNGNQIVLFYGSNSWSYTRVGHIDDLTGWADVLGSGGITAVFTLAE